MSAISKVLALDALLDVRRTLKREGKTVVFTNGCFDLLHVGHIRSLQEARALGDVLIVGLNSDASVRQIKGPGHPIVPQDERAELLASLACVDFVTLFDEPTPEQLIAALQPDIHCKGGDYASGKPMPEAEVVAAYGGQVRILSYTPGHSTTTLSFSTAMAPLTRT